jgi:hypothetical protein
MSKFTSHLGLTMAEDERGWPIKKDGRCTWLVETPLAYEVGEEGSGETITVPRGATTDLASIPRFAWSVGFPPDGPWLKAAVIHDNLYRRRGDVIRTRPAPYTRSEADGILREAMKVLGVGAFERGVIWWAVRLGGAGGWGS